MKIRGKYDKEYYEKNKEKIRIYYLNNKEKILEKEKEYYKNNAGKILKYKKEYYLDNIEKFEEYYLNNKEKISEHKKIRYLNNKEKINKKSVKHRNDRKSYDTLYKLICNIRCLIVSSIKLKGYRKVLKTEKILGCNFEEFKIYLESKFECWMNWSNYGNWNGEPNEINVAWDIDHIIPLCSAKTEEEILKLNHYTNLQPLCSYTNRHIKRDNIDFKI
jgi:hypothetical protein